MSDFTAKITAQLDTSKIPSQIKGIEKTPVKLSNFTVDTKGISSKIKSALNGQKFTITIDNVKLGANALSGQIKKVGTNAAKSISEGLAKDTQYAFRQMLDIQKSMSSVKVKLGGLDSSKNSSQIQVLRTQLHELESDYQSIQRVFSGGNLSADQLGKIQTVIENTKQKLSELDAKASDTQRRLAESISTKVPNGDIGSSISKVTAEYERLSTTGHAKLSQIKQDIAELNRLQTQMNGSKDASSLIANYEKYNNVLSRVKNSLATVSAESKSFVSALQIKTLDNKIVDWMNKNSKAAKQFGTEIDNIRARLANLQPGNVGKEFSQIQNDFAMVQQGAIAAGKTGRTFGSQFAASLSSIGKYISASTLIYGSIRGLKEMYQNVVNIDSEMVELKKVTDESDEAYSTFLSGANQKAQNIGTTISGLVSSTADFARLGYTFEESQKLAETANIYAVVGDEIDSVDTATKHIISTMAAYNVKVEDSMSIADKFNEVGNNFAISSGGIGEAMERSASSLAAANNTIDESIALIAAANTVVNFVPRNHSNMAA